jgi:hypothetical protein
MCGVRAFARYIAIGLQASSAPAIIKAPTQQLGGVVLRGSTLHPPKDHAVVVIHPFVP